MKKIDFKRVFNLIKCRCLSTQAKLDVHPRYSTKMQGWQIHSYGNLDELQLDKNIKTPVLKSPTELLIKVNASSVNPIDVAMISGYGASVLNTMRLKEGEIEFPLILGRDFAGTIVQKGLGISDRDLNIGDNVWGVVPVHKQGCHGEYVAVEKYCVSKKPSTLDDIDASAVLYAGLTAWSGLFVSGQLGDLMGALCPGGGSGAKGKRVLVLGAAGGVGSIAVQMLLAEEVDVFATCSTDAIPMIKNLGADLVLDYTDPNHATDLVVCGPYDIILDCAGKGTEYANSLNWKFKNYVTFSSPLLKNIDNHGITCGLVKNAVNIFQNNFSSLSSQNGVVKWGYFIPAPQGIEYIKNLAERNKLLPVVEKVFKYEDTFDAYKRVQEGHLRGKIVIDCK